MKYGISYWHVVVGAFFGIVLGLTAFMPVKRDNCIPQGYGRTPVDLHLRASDGFL